MQKSLEGPFEGHRTNCIECINMDFKYQRKASFYDLQLDVKGCKNVYASFDKYVEVEWLEGDNKYHAEDHGLQDAKRGVLFIDFLPVLQLQLKRFEHDFMRDTTVKINDCCEFPLQTNPGFNDTPFKFTKHSNAYMVVYIRESNKDKIICDVDEKDIAKHLRMRLKKEQEEKEDKRRYKAQTDLYLIIKVARDEDLREQIGKYIYFDLVDHDKVRRFRIQKQKPFNLFKEEVAKEFCIPVQFLRFWIWAKRQNHTCRPNRLLTSQEEGQTVEFSHPNAELRLLEVFYHKIYKVFPLCEKVENINDQYWTLRAEEVPQLLPWSSANMVLYRNLSTNPPNKLLQIAVKIDQQPVWCFNDKISCTGFFTEDGRMERGTFLENTGAGGNLLSAVTELLSYARADVKKCGNGGGEVSDTSFSSFKNVLYENISFSNLSSHRKDDNDDDVEKGEEATSGIKLDFGDKKSEILVPVFLKEGCGVESLLQFINLSDCNGFLSFTKILMEAYPGNVEHIIPHVVWPWPDHRVRYVVNERGRDRFLYPLELDWGVFSSVLGEGHGRVVFRKIGVDRNRLRAVLVNLELGVRESCLYKHYTQYSYRHFIKALYLLWCGWVDEEPKDLEFKNKIDLQDLCEGYKVVCLDNLGKTFRPPSYGVRRLREFLSPNFTSKQAEDLFLRTDIEEYEDFCTGLHAVVMVKKG